MPFAGCPNMSQTNPRWWRASIFIKLKNCNKSATDWRILTKFGMMMHFGSLDPQLIKFENFWNPWWWWLASWIIKKSQYLYNGLISFDEICHNVAMMHLASWTLSGNEIWECYISKIVAIAILKKNEKSLYGCSTGCSIKNIRFIFSSFLTQMLINSNEISSKCAP